MVYKLYKWYILPIGVLYATYHLLGEPETTIEKLTKISSCNPGGEEVFPKHPGAFGGGRSNMTGVFRGRDDPKFAGGLKYFSDFYPLGKWSNWTTSNFGVETGNHQLVQICGVLFSLFFFSRIVVSFCQKNNVWVKSWSGLCLVMSKWATNDHFPY